MRKIAMDSAKQTFTVKEIVDLVVDRLTESGGLANLQETDLDTLEDTTIRCLDQITREVLSTLLKRQALGVEVPCECPRCGGPVKRKKEEARHLESRRGSISFKTPVVHCEACRLDFFPSVQNSQL